MEEGYSICFNKWALDKDIKNELGLLLIISSLTAEEGYCYASNKYLAELFGTDEAQISKKIAKLVKKGYLKVFYKKRGTEIISREITIVKNDNRPLSKMTMDHCQNSQSTIVKNDKENNTSNNNTSNNKEKEIKKKKFTPPTLEEVEAYVKENGLTVNAKDFVDYFEATGWVDAKGQKVVSWKGKIRTWQRFQPQARGAPAPKEKASFGDIRRKMENDENGNGADFGSDTNILSEVLSEYDIE